jgi:hypothetical protein
MTNQAERMEIFEEHSNQSFREMYILLDSLGEWVQSYVGTVLSQEDIRRIFQIFKFSKMMYFF